MCTSPRCCRCASAISRAATWKPAWMVELAQVAACVPLVAVRYQISPARNPVGMEANIALPGVGLVVFGVFNLVFFPMLLRTGSRLGVPVALGLLGRLADRYRGRDRRAPGRHAR